MLTICEQHGQSPSWWNSLSRMDRARLMAKRQFDKEQAHG